MTSARDRAAKRAGHDPGPMRPAPAENVTAYRRAMDQQARAELAAWVAVRNVAGIMAAGWLVAALVALAASGWRLAAVCLGFTWIFASQRPPPSETLDSYTDRKGR